MPPRDAPVWRLWVRLVHWALALLIVIDLVVEAGANPWHRWIGYAAAALVSGRLLAGAIGAGPTSLAAMGRAARQAPGYAKQFASARGQPWPGHNPLGAWMSFTIWALVLFLGITGWITQLDRFWGEEWLHRVHTVAAYVLGGCACLHIVGVLTASRVYRTNLPRRMVTGRE